MALEPELSRLSLTAAFTLGLLVAACDRGTPDTVQESTATPAPTGEIDRSQAGTLMPASNVRDLQGDMLNMGALQGTPVLVNLWATWCAPCVKEMPLLDELAVDYDSELRVLTVSQDMQGAEKVGPFFAERDFAMLGSWMDPEGELGFAIGGGVMPTTVLYDAMGQELWRVSGDYDWSSEDARAAIDEAIGG
ncbi:TlpA disulfide reductase family protein [Qipengyuania sp. XHP0211]|nr:TlpA disulfide reductase family protein [Qipengyuania sp. XHP0211]MDG5749904.1 TlpA disulfide reductase family protein [Qipengyuania sp. XHP0211]